MFQRGAKADIALLYSHKVKSSVDWMDLPWGGKLCSEKLSADRDEQARAHCWAGLQLCAGVCCQLCQACWVRAYLSGRQARIEHQVLWYECVHVYSAR